MICSVVIPLYNKASHVRRAIESVLAQSVRDFELIVVDDGSTDGGLDVVRSVEDGRIHVVQQQHSGVSAARNRGAQEAAAEVVAFLDADDTWTPEFLKTAMSLRERLPEAAVWGTRTGSRTRRKARIPEYRGGLPVDQ